MDNETNEQQKSDSDKTKEEIITSDVTDKEEEKQKSKSSSSPEPPKNEGKQEAINNSSNSIPTWESHVFPHGDLVELFKGRMWQVEGTLKKTGEGMKRNMVVFKMEDSGELWCHSVVALNDEGMKKLESFGKVGVILVPNGQHTFDSGVWQRRFPDAKLYCPSVIKPTLLQKGLRVDGNAEEVSWEKYGIRVMIPSGVKKSGGFGVGGELVFELKLDENSTGIVVTDILANNPSSTSGLKKFFTGNSFECNRIIRWAVLTNSSQFKNWLIKLSESSTIKILSVAHGAPVTENTIKAIRDAANKL